MRRTPHLGGVAYGWFCETFGRTTEPMPFDVDADPRSDMRAEADENAEEVLALGDRRAGQSPTTSSGVGELESVLEPMPSWPSKL